MSTITTISTSTSDRRKRLLYLSLAGALLTACLLGVAATRTDDAHSRREPPGLTVHFGGASTPEDALVYIVSSEEEKDALLAREFPSLGFYDSDVSRRTVVIEPGQEESLALLAELLPTSGFTTGLGPKLTLVDLR